jgi:Immunity protein 63
MTTLHEIEKLVRALAARIDAPEGVLPTFGHTEDGARPHVEVDSRGFHYVVVERGQEQSRSTTPEQDELLRLIFDTITFDLACSFEARNRVGARDTRRLLFSKQVELLAKLSPSWAARKVDDHIEILREHPFDDWVSERLDLFAQLKRGGRISPADAWQKACEKFPEPQS